MSENAADPQWVIVLRRAFRRFLWILAPTAFWLLLGGMNFLTPSLFHVGCMVLSVGLFFLALPLSAFFRLDQIAMEYGIENTNAIFFVALVFVAVNLVCWGFFQLGWRSLKKKIGPQSSLEQANKPVRRERSPKNEQLH